MIDIKMLKDTGPYNQMKRYIAEEHADLSPQQRAGKFTALLRQYVRNCNEQHGHRNVVMAAVVGSFTWVETPEGEDLWRKIERFSRDLVVKQVAPKKEPVVKAEELLVKPALVWPEGATHYRVVGGVARFFNKEGQWPIYKARVVKFVRFEGVRTYDDWCALPDTIKRPETPLPKVGMLWPEGYTHHNNTLFIGNGGFFLKEDKYAYYKEGVLVERNITKIELNRWLVERRTTQRYPDNQPLVLGAPIAVPKAFAGRAAALAAHHVQAAPQAAVELPKAAPVKKPVGWWT